MEWAAVSLPPPSDSGGGVGGELCCNFNLFLRAVDVDVGEQKQPDSDSTRLFAHHSRLNTDVFSVRSQSQSRRRITTDRSKVQKLVN